MEAVQSFREELQAAVISPPDSRPDWQLGQMIGRSAAMQRLFSQMRHTARHLRLAAIEGEPGAGKMLAARTLHQFSPDRESAFVPCLTAEFLNSDQPDAAALPDLSNSPILKQASSGTLVLTHVDDLPAAHQLRLLKMLEWIDHQQIQRSFHAIPHRILFLSCRPLRKLAASGVLRSELANRLSAIKFVLPALRERREDIPLLCDLFVQHFSAMHGKSMRGISPQALPRLIQHLWPENIRELESIIHAAALSCPGQWIRPIDLPAFNAGVEFPAPSSVPVMNDDPNLDRAILRHIQGVLNRVDGNKLRAAKMLGISRSTLYRLLDSANMSTN